MPITLNPDGNLISRSTIPLMLQPSPTTDSSLFGLGDISETLFLSPVHPGSIIWGVGPALTFPTAINSILGTGKWLAGPSAVALVTPDPLGNRGAYQQPMHQTQLRAAGHLPHYIFDRQLDFEVCVPQPDYAA